MLLLGRSGCSRVRAAAHRSVSLYARSYKEKERITTGPNESLFAESQKDEKKAWRPDQANRTREANMATSAMAKCTRAKDYVGALEIYNGLTERDGPLYNSALTACTRASWRDKVLDLWSDIPQDKKCVVTYGIMLSHFGKMRRIDEVDRLVGEMRHFGIEPTIVTITTMISAYSIAGRPQEAINAFHSIDATALRTATKASQQIVYCAVMTATARAGDYAAAHELFTKMSEAAVPADQRHFNALLVACARNADAATAQGVFDTMIAWKLNPRSEDYTALLSCSRYNLERCKGIFEEMKQANVVPNALAYQELLEAHVLANDAAGARALLALDCLDRDARKVRVLTDRIGEMP